MNLNRRRFLQAAVAAGAVLAWPRRAYPFAQSIKGIRKFIVTLPGLGPQGANNLGTLIPGVSGNYLPVLAEDATLSAEAGVTVYSIVAAPFSQRIHPDIPETRFWGYADQVNNLVGPGGTPDLKYLGGVIVATTGTPVQLRVTNQLPEMHLLPVDESLVDPSKAPTGGRTDIIAVHLHGGFLFWDSDGGPFAWFANPSNNESTPMAPVTGPSFQNPMSPGPAPGPGTAIYNYPNTAKFQSARLMWYHDHAYSLTRTNVYAGLATAYLITDEDPNGEHGLLTRGVVPGIDNGQPLMLGNASYEFGIPLIIQDKTFWDGVTDPGYKTASPSSPTAGDLWYPHVYEGGNDPDDLPSMQISQLPGTLTARWGATAPDGSSPFTDETQFPPNSTVPEFFSDTNLVNGAPYPTVTVPPRRLRFRILNASNARFYNLQLYVADSTPDAITYADTSQTDNNGNSTLAPTNRPGPAFIQIGNEGGFLPEPMVFSPDSTTSSSGTAAPGNFNSNRIIGYKSMSSPGVPGVVTRSAGVPHRAADAGIEAKVHGDTILLNAVAGDPTIGNVDRYNLLLAPAERADLIIDFRGFQGQKLILYNDAPAPFPGGDIRNDYFVGAPDLSSIGGAPSTPTAPLGTQGVGPDTRLLMQFVVETGANSTEMTFAQTVAALQDKTSGLPAVFAATQPDPNALLTLADATTAVGKSLGEDNGDGFGRLRQRLGDGAANFTDLVAAPIDEALAGEVQRWMIFNTTADTHPMHFHLVNVAVRQRGQWAFTTDTTGATVPDLSSGKLEIITATLHDPDPNEMGWKDTVRINPGEVAIVDMQFTLPTADTTNPLPPTSNRLQEMFGLTAYEYVWHCHILEHEEHDMMHAVVIMPAP